MDSKIKSKKENGNADVTDKAPDPNVKEQAKPRPTPMEIFGTLTSVMMQSQPHRHLFLSDLDWWLFPALRLNQVRIFHDGKRAIGFALWAKVSDEVDAELNRGTHKLRPADWKSGKQLWLMELIVPSANPKLLQDLLGELLKGPFAGEKFKMHLKDPKTGKLRAAELGPKVSSEEIEAAAADKAQQPSQ